MNIIDFIEARIAEDEQIAQAARPGPWIDEHGTRIGPKIGDGYLMVPESELAPCEDYIPDGDTTHIARHDPERVQSRSAAIRTIIEDRLVLLEQIDNEWGCCHSANQIRRGECKDNPLGSDSAFRALAAIYRDHPDYDTTWS